MKNFFVAILTLLPLAAVAHVGDHSALNWKAGFLHPWTGLDHLLALVATGVWLAQSQTRRKWELIAGFTGVLTLAIVIGQRFTHLTFEMGIIATLVVLGAFMACAVRGSLALRALVIGATAAVHGFIHGTELPPGDGLIPFASALILSSALVVMAAMGLETQTQKVAKDLVARMLGASLILFGIGMAF